MAKRSATGDPQQIAPGRWRLNPQAPFAVTIEGGDAKVIASLKRALEKSLDGSRDSLDRGFYLFSKHRLRCLEVDAWVDDVRAEFLAGIARRKEASAEYSALAERSEATERRRERLEAAFIQDAYSELRIRPSRDHSAVLAANDDHDRRLAEFELMADAYWQADHGMDRTRRHEEYRQDVPVRGWRIEGSEEACAYCRQFFGTHPPTYYPRIPIHVGCVCEISPVSGW
jgi:hypothetical protein